jgi:hypothetical protein
MGTWATPDTVEKAEKLAILLKGPIRADEALDKLFDIVGDDAFFDSVDELLHSGNHKADVSYMAAERVGKWLNDLDMFMMPWDAKAIPICTQAVAECKARHFDAIAARVARRFALAFAKSSMKTITAHQK